MDEGGVVHCVLRRQLQDHLYVGGVDNLRLQAGGEAVFEMGRSDSGGGGGDVGSQAMDCSGSQSRLGLPASSHRQAGGLLPLQKSLVVWRQPRAST